MIFKNRYQFSGVIMAKLAVNIASFIWATIVLFKPDALISFKGYSGLTYYVHEDVVAGLLILISSLQFYRLVTCAKPISVGISGYAILTLFWMYVWWNILIQPGPIWPASLATVSTLVCLSIYAFVANPKRHDC